MRKVNNVPGICNALGEGKLLALLYNNPEKYDNCHVVMWRNIRGFDDAEGHL
jgi:hypothetical protein